MSPKLFIALLLLCLNTMGQSSNYSVQQSLYEKVDEALKKSSVRGASISLIEDGKTSTHTWAATHYPEISNKTTFRAGSLSKLVTSLLVLKAHEENRLALSDPVEKYLPNIFQNNELGSPTIEQLLEHTAGLSGSTYAEYAENSPDLSPTAYVAKNSPFALRWKPGYHYSYANPGHTIAAAILEKIYVKSFDDIARDQLFAPLGMSSSHFHNTEQLSPLLSATYGPSGDLIQELWEMPVRPAGSLVSSPSELTKLQLMLLNEGLTKDGKRILSEASVQRLHHAKTSAAARSGAHNGAYSLGNFGFIASDHVFRGHWGRTDGFQTNFGYLPDQKSGFIIMLNTADRSAMHQLRKFIADYLTANIAPPAATESIKNLTQIQPGYYQNYSHDMPMRGWIFALLQAKKILPTASGISVQPVIGSHTQNYIETATNLYQAEGIPIPTATFKELDGTQYFIDSESYRKTSGFAIYSQLGVITLGHLASVILLLLSPILFFRNRKKSLSASPLIFAILASVNLLGLSYLFYIYGLQGMGRELGSPTLVSILLLACSVAIPLGSFITFILKRKSLPYLAFSFSTVAYSILLAFNGWIPLITW